MHLVSSRKILADYDASSLHETIPNFHNTPDRLRKFKEALKADVLHRAADISDDIAFVLDHEADCSYMTDLLAAGKTATARYPQRYQAQ